MVEAVLINVVMLRLSVTAAAGSEPVSLQTWRGR
jgi:hypothetical protein